jgi:hypothetical protein
MDGRNFLLFSGARLAMVLWRCTLRGSLFALSLLHTRLFFFLTHLHDFADHLLLLLLKALLRVTLRLRLRDGPGESLLFFFVEMLGSLHLLFAHLGRLRGLCCLGRGSGGGRQLGLGSLGLLLLFVLVHDAANLLSGECLKGLLVEFLIALVHQFFEGEKVLYRAYLVHDLLVDGVLGRHCT